MQNRLILNIETEKVYIITEEYIKKCALQKRNYSFWKKVKLVRYLKKSYFVFPALDLASCIFSQELVNLPESLYTDGTWIWSADLIHYTQKYNFKWSDEFINYLEQKKYKIKKFTDTEQSNLEKSLFTTFVIQSIEKVLGIQFTEEGFEEFKPPP